MVGGSIRDSMWWLMVVAGGCVCWKVFVVCVDGE